MMANTISGAELKAFYNDHRYWVKQTDINGTDAWHEDLVLEVNGVERGDDFSITEDLKDEDHVTIVRGNVCAYRDGFAEISFESNGTYLTFFGCPFFLTSALAVVRVLVSSG